MIVGLLCAVSALADVTVTFADLDLPGAPTEFMGGTDFKFVVAKNKGSNAPAYNTSGKDLRLYAKNTIKVTGAADITSMVFNISTKGKEQLAEISASTGSVTVNNPSVGDWTVTWTGNAAEVTLTVGDKCVYGTAAKTKAGQFCFSSVDIKGGVSGPLDPNEIEAPTISNDKGLVTIINNAEGSTIYYSVNNETCDATSTPYTAPFTVEKGDVVRAMAIDGEKASQVVEATITWLKTEYASLAEFIAEKPAHLVTFTCPFTAIYQDGKNLYVTDGTDQILVYGDVNQTYVNGDIIPAGAQGSFLDFNGTYEIEKPANFGVPTSGTPVEPEVVTTADFTTAIGNHYVVVKEATLTASTIIDAKGEAPVQDKFKKNLTGSDVDVYGFVSVYVSSSATKIQIAPVEIQESIGSNTPEQVVSTPAVVEDEIEITRGESVTFTSRYAAKLKIEVDGHEPLVVEGREYVYTPEEEAIVTVTPIGADGKEYAEMSLMVMISFKAAPLCGEVTFDPADGTALFAGSKVTVAYGRSPVFRDMPRPRRAHCNARGICRSHKNDHARP